MSGGKAGGLWHGASSAAQLDAHGRGTLSELLGITIEEIGPDFLRARMPVTARHLQPYGLLHGGASMVLAETVGSLAATLAVDRSRFRCVGQEINANHLRSALEGDVITALARPVHVGQRSHVWSIEMRDQRDRLVCISRFTVAVVPSTHGPRELESCSERRQRGRRRRHRQRRRSTRHGRRAPGSRRAGRARRGPLLRQCRPRAPADVVACFTEDAEVLIRHGDNPTRRFAARAAPGVPHISEFWRHLNANFDARFEHFSHVIDIEQQCSAATFVVTLAPKPASPYRERGTLTLQNCNFFWLRDGRIARMIVYYANPDSGGAAAGRPTGYGPPQG
ncbi:MAG: hotdog fold thioesterase [Steroidobacteraceae bacterium]